MKDFFTINGEQVSVEGAPLLSYRTSEEIIAANVNAKEVDLSYIPRKGDSVSWISRQSTQGLEILRHDTAHLLAQALKELFGDNIAIAIGPTVQDGFYYDFLHTIPLSTDDFDRIEKKMHDLVKQKIAITRHIWSRQEALTFFKDKKENFKEEIIRDIDENEALSVYSQGDFHDLCRGPHAPDTSSIGHAFKLLRIAGAYWRGDSKNVMLQRIYGTAWCTKKELDEHLTLIQEAKERDHRYLGERAQLFFMDPVAKGSVFWMPSGWIAYKAIEDYMRRTLAKHGYQEIKTPLFFDKSLWEKSGHQDKFSESMYYLQQHDDERPSSLKPMNCPGHIELFNKHPKTYKDLPIRLAEFGSCCRHEPSGALLGLMRLRNFTQDDAHIFCTPEQVQEEAENFCKLLKEVYKQFGFKKIHVKLATKPDDALGSQEEWDTAEQSLRQALERTNTDYDIHPKEGAFYGPKLEFVLEDALKRHWQCGTLQLDYVLPKRLKATYTDSSDKKQTPVLLHRAILGSIERFFAILVEHTKGILPLWLAPHQVAILTITKDVSDYAQECIEALQAAQLRVHADLRNKPIGFKIRAAIDKRVPFIFSIGKNEAKRRTVSVKQLGTPESTSLPFQEALNLLSRGSHTE